MNVYLYGGRKITLEHFKPTRDHYNLLTRLQFETPNLVLIAKHEGHLVRCTVDQLYLEFEQILLINSGM